MSQFFKYWLPILAWMAIIFSASSDSHSYEHSSRFFEPLLHWLFPHMTQDHIERIHYAVRKCGHLTEYAILGWLLWRIFHQSKTKLPDWSWPRVGGVLLIVFLYGATDEFHQNYVATRTPHFTDVLIDTTGGAIGLLIVWLIHLRNKTKTKKSESVARQTG